jgi:hypothetical protein
MAINGEFLIGLVIMVVALGMAAIATASSIRNTRGPRERRFVVSNCGAAWIVLAALFGLMWLTPSPYRYILMVAYCIHLPFMTYRFTTKQQLLRRLDNIHWRHPET